MKYTCYRCGAELKANDDEETEICKGCGCVIHWL